MANEISITASLTAFKNTVMSSAIGRSWTGVQRDMSGNFYISNSILVSLAGTQIPVGQVAQPHYAAFYSNPLYNTALLDTAVTITGAASNGGPNLIRITAPGHAYITGDVVTIAAVSGTTEANATWPITVISSSTFDLVGSTFANAYVSGGTSQLNNSIHLRNGSAGTDFAQLFPGDIAIVPLLVGGQVWGYSNASLQSLEYEILSL